MIHPSQANHCHPVRTSRFSACSIPRSFVSKQEVMHDRPRRRKAVQDEPDWFKVPTYLREDGVSILRLPRNDSRYDYSDQRVIKNGENELFDLDFASADWTQPRWRLTLSFRSTAFCRPTSKYEEFGIEDPRITHIGDELLHHLQRGQPPWHYRSFDGDDRFRYLRRFGQYLPFRQQRLRHFSNQRSTANTLRCIARATRNSVNPTFGPPKAKI
ncbi:MAG: hypothetical protein MZU97_01165 [Bacillus subtilis]|nr:hypothetical protein [Bacillus subtilis]